MVMTPEDLAQLRADIEATLPDTCTITTKGVGEPVFDEDTGTYDLPERTVIHADLPCRVAPATATQVVQAGEEAVSLGMYRVTVPATADGIEVDHLVLITGSSDDPDLVGTQLRVTETFRRSLGAKKRIACKVVL